MIFTTVERVMNHVNLVRTEEPEQLEGLLILIQEGIEGLMADSFDKGYIEGTVESNSYDLGWESGQADGYEDGHSDGYEEGYRDGLHEAELEFAS